MEVRRVEAGGDSAELFGSGASGGEIVRREHDLGVGGEQAGAAEVTFGVVELAPEGRDGGGDIALSEAEEGEAGLGVAAQLVGPTIGLRGESELSAKAVELPLLVDGVGGGRRIVVPGEELAGALDLLERVGPGAVEQIG